MTIYLATIAMFIVLSTMAYIVNLFFRPETSATTRNDIMSAVETIKRIQDQRGRNRNDLAARCLNNALANLDEAHEAMSN